MTDQSVLDNPELRFETMLKHAAVPSFMLPASLQPLTRHAGVLVKKSSYEFDQAFAGQPVHGAPAAAPCIYRLAQMRSDSELLIAIGGRDAHLSLARIFGALGQIEKEGKLPIESVILAYMQCRYGETFAVTATRSPEGYELEATATGLAGKWQKDTYLLVPYRLD